MLFISNQTLELGWMKLWVFSHPLQHRCEKEQESVSQEVEMAPFEDSDYQLDSQRSDDENSSEKDHVSQEVKMAPVQNQYVAVLSIEDSDYQLESQMSDEKNASEKYQESMSQEVKMAPVQHQYVFTEKEIIMSFQPPWRPW